jgi:molybdate transport system substrate-binding protein
MDLHILSAGAAQGVVKALQPGFSAEAKVDMKGTFGAVGLMKEKFLAGAPCDVLILTAAQIAELLKTGHVGAHPIMPLGSVKTGVAVRAGDPIPDVSNAAALKKAMLAARGIYLPDPEKATAGIHFANVLKLLGIYSEVERNLRPYPNGATAMQHLAQATESGLIGCTQVTEILYTDNVTLVGPLPKEFELATVYSAAVSSKASQAAIASALVQLLGAKQSQSIRTDGGFEPVNG